jgi:hypothetical protein
MFGDAAIDRLATPEWIGDPMYAAFAIRTIARAGAMGANRAIPELQRALDFVANDVLRSDISYELSTLGIKPKAPRRIKSAGATTAMAMSVDELVIGACYRRRDLHLAGLGGNWQRGISYPATGTHCLLFSDPSKASEYGYRDEPVGDDGYRYFGEWNGSGDMVMSGGNQVVVDRSPELYLFTDAACGRVFRGRYVCAGWNWERTTRDGQELRAIVFDLHLASQS